ncbi:MAG: isocitrate lyase/PEP mutase family protein [Nitrososphaerota archaeon]
MRGAELRRLLRTQPYTYTTGVYTPLQAKLAEMVGFKLAYLSGYSASLGYLGKADLGLLSMAEMVAIARQISSAVNIPVIADADDGYGSAIVAMRTVREFEKSGVAGIHVEDQKGPKRCGHLIGKMVLPFDEAVLKFKAIIKAREDPDFVIIARTDAFGAVGGSLDEAIRRGLAYAGAGADMVWCEFSSPDQVAEAEKFAESIHREYPSIPLVFNYSSSFKWSRSRHRLTFERIAGVGYKLIIVSMGAIHAEMYAVWNFLDDLLKKKEEAQWRLEELKTGHPTENHHTVGEFEKFKKLEEEYLLPSILEERYGRAGKA